MSLVQLFTAIANAIRSKKGTSAAIAAEDFATEITSIPTGVDTSDANAVAGDIVTGKTAYAKGLKLTGTYTGIVPTGSVNITENGTIDVTNYASADVNVSGGGGQTIEPKDVNFYDYDGTLLHSYTLAEANALTELPELPTQEGLTCQEWNWTLADIKAYGKPVDVGATYTTDDGKTRINISIEVNGSFTIPLYFRQSVANGVQVDWGDGSAVQTYAGSGSTRISPTHTYTQAGDYTITLNPTGNCQLTLGANSASYSIVGMDAQNHYVYKNMVKSINIGAKTNFSLAALAQFNALEKMSIPNTVTTMSNNLMDYCYSIKFLVIPKSITAIGEYTFNYCTNLEKVSLPNTMTSIGTYAFNYCYSLKDIIFPNSVTSIASGAFYYCGSLSKVTLPSSLTALSGSTFNSCKRLPGVKVPATVTSIGGNCFGSCGGLQYVDFSDHASIPTLANTNGFSGTGADSKIIVPDDLYDNWKTASNWSTYASRVVKASEA